MGGKQSLALCVGSAAFFCVLAQSRATSRERRSFFPQVIFDDRVSFNETQRRKIIWKLDDVFARLEAEQRRVRYCDAAVATNIRINVTDSKFIESAFDGSEYVDVANAAARYSPVLHTIAVDGTKSSSILQRDLRHELHHALYRSINSQVSFAAPYPGLSSNKTITVQNLRELNSYMNAGDAEMRNYFLLDGKQKLGYTLSQAEKSKLAVYDRAAKTNISPDLYMPIKTANHVNVDADEQAKQVLDLFNQKYQTECKIVSANVITMGEKSYLKMRCPDPVDSLKLDMLLRYQYLADARDFEHYQLCTAERDAHIQELGPEIVNVFYAKLEDYHHGQYLSWVKFMQQRYEDYGLNFELRVGGV